MLIRYTIWRITGETRQKLVQVAWILGPLATGPVMVWAIQDQLGFDTQWFSVWLVGGNLDHPIFTGLYWIIGGIFLFVFGVLVGDKTLEVGQRDPDSLRGATNPYGIISQLMIVCQIGGIFILIGGVLQLLIAIERFFS